MKCITRIHIYIYIILNSHIPKYVPYIHKPVYLPPYPHKHTTLCTYQCKILPLHSVDCKVFVFISKCAKVSVRLSDSEPNFPHSREHEGHNCGHCSYILFTAMKHEQSGCIAIATYRSGCTAIATYPN